MIFSKIKVYAFVGPSGTGKSYRAQMVAGEKNVSYIIDDGLLIKDNQVIAGTSAKKASTKIATVKHALFTTKEQKDEIKYAIKKYNPDGILILGTSDDMVHKIAENLGLPRISEILYINQFATEEEMSTAKRIRQTQGKHVIPVPTFEIKKDFSGFLLDPLQIFKIKGKDKKPYISEKSIIRPTFSYLGNFQISDTVIRQIINYLVKKNDNIKILRTRIDKYGDGITIYIEVSLKYGINLLDTVKDIRKRIVKEIENLTSMYIENLEIVVKTIYMEDKNV